MTHLAYCVARIYTIHIAHIQKQKEEKSKFHIWSVGYIWKIFKNEDFGFEIFEKGEILRPFSDLKTENFFKNVG